ncbi:MAG: N-acetylmuramoyl-L-alanine amidase, partial [Candidatus Electrothrix sp. AR4]|nr:N-acetylmuramoyl-L-alanine amidase [Candidatus Electrothrix sp. AR4]
MPLACQFHNNFRRFSNICFHFLILVLLTGLSASTGAGSTVVPSISRSSYKETVEGQYKEASDYYYRLKDNFVAAGKREKWLAGIHELQRIYRIDPKSEIASFCLYTIARMYRNMYKRFGSSTDLDKAVSFYTDILSFFPQGNKADNAIYALAQIEQKERDNPKQAAKYYYKLIKSYPASSKKIQAEKQLQKLIASLKTSSVARKSVVATRVKGKEKTAAWKKSVLPMTARHRAGVKGAGDAPSGLLKKNIVPIKSTKPAQRLEETKRPVSKTKIVLSALKNVTSSHETQRGIGLPKVTVPVIKEKNAASVRQAVASAAPKVQYPKQGKERSISRKDKKVVTGQQADMGRRVVMRPATKWFDTDRKHIERARGTVKVLPVQYWSSDNYSRVVIKASEPVAFHATLLDKSSRSPKHLSIDFKKSYIPPKYRSPVAIEDGLLKRIHTGQLDDATVRVYIETESISDYKVFSLKDPFRVVVDVRGKRGRALRAPEKKTPPHIETAAKQVPQLIDKSEEVLVFPSKKKGKVKLTPASVPSKKNASLTLAQQLGLGVRRIVIDPGHGGKDPGATGFGLKEKEVVLNVAKKIRKILQEKHNYEVFLTREGDESISLEERTAIANTKEADLFLSIHVNAHPEDSVRGVETFYLNLATHTEAMRVAAFENATSTHNMSEMQEILSELMQNEKINESSQLAEFVQLNMVRGLKEQKYWVKDLGVKQAPFYVLIGAEMPAVLAEISFITNPDEAKLLKNEKYLQTIAKQIVAGVLS